MKNTKLVIGLSLFLLLVIFTLQNTAIVDIWFLIWKFSISRALLLFLVLSVGMVLGWLLKTMISESKADKSQDN